MIQVSQCPQCGATNASASARCEYCDSPFFFAELRDFPSGPDIDLAKALQFFRNYKSADAADDETRLAVRQSLGLCYLKQRAFPLALNHFSKMIDEFPHLGKPYVYKVLAMLGGKKPRTLTLKTVREIIGILNLAHMLDGTNGQALAQLAVIEYDYYKRNGLRFPEPSPFELIATARSEGMSFDELLASIELIGLSEDDVQELI